MLTVGVPQLFVEASISRPHDVGFAKRREGTDGSVRVQGYCGQLIVGVSHARSNPYMPLRFALGRQVFTGVDARWAHRAGVQARGGAPQRAVLRGCVDDRLVRRRHRASTWDGAVLPWSCEASLSTTTLRHRGPALPASHAGHARPAAGAGDAAAELSAPARRPAAHQEALDRFQRDVFVQTRSPVHEFTSSLVHEFQAFTYDGDNDSMAQPHGGPRGGRRPCAGGAVARRCGLDRHARGDAQRRRARHRQSRRRALGLLPARRRARGASRRNRRASSSRSPSSDRS